MLPVMCTRQGISILHFSSQKIVLAGSTRHAPCPGRLPKVPCLPHFRTHPRLKAVKYVQVNSSYYRGDCLWADAWESSWASITIKTTLSGHSSMRKRMPEPSRNG